MDKVRDRYWPGVGHAASQLETDDDEARFNDRLKKIAMAKVQEKDTKDGD